MKFFRRIISKKSSTLPDRESASGFRGPSTGGSSLRRSRKFKMAMDIKSQRKFVAFYGAPDRDTTSRNRPSHDMPRRVMPKPIRVPTLPNRYGHTVAFIPPPYPCSTKLRHKAGAVGVKGGFG